MTQWKQMGMRWQNGYNIYNWSQRSDWKLDIMNTVPFGNVWKSYEQDYPHKPTQTASM